MSNSSNANANVAFVIGTILGMALSDIDRDMSSWERDSLNRKARAQELRQYSRNCQACGVGGTSNGPTGSRRVSPRDARNQQDMLDKAARLAAHANRLDASVVSRQAVWNLQDLARQARMNFDRQPLRLRGVNIS